MKQNLDRNKVFTDLTNGSIAALLFKTSYIKLTPIILVAGRGASFRRDALRQRAFQSKQRKIDTRTARQCFNGLGVTMLH